MKKLLSAVMSVAFMVAMTPMADAQSQCPPEVAQAKAMISKISKGPEVQAPRSLAGAKQDVQAPRSREIQAPRGQEVQAPRGQEVQAPRGKQEVQAPRGQEVQAPRGQDVQAPRSLAGAKPTGDASKLIREAEAACKAGDMTTAKAKAEAAMATLK